MGESHSKRRRMYNLLCCLPFQQEEYDSYFFQPRDVPEELCDYVVEKLAVKKVPLSLFAEKEDLQSLNKSFVSPLTVFSQAQNLVENRLTPYNFTVVSSSSSRTNLCAEVSKELLKSDDSNLEMLLEKDDTNLTNSIITVKRTKELFNSIDERKSNVSVQNDEKLIPQEKSSFKSNVTLQNREIRHKTSNFDNENVLHKKKNHSELIETIEKAEERKKSNDRYPSMMCNSGCGELLHHEDKKTRKVFSEIRNLSSPEVYWVKVEPKKSKARRNKLSEKANPKSSFLNSTRIFSRIGLFKQKEEKASADEGSGDSKKGNVSSRNRCHSLEGRISKCDEHVQTDRQSLASLKDDIKKLITTVGGSVISQTNRTTAEKSVLTDKVDPMETDLSVSLSKNVNGSPPVLEEKSCQTDSKLSVLRLKDVIEDDPLFTVNFESRKRYKMGEDILQLDRELPEKEMPVPLNTINKQESSSTDRSVRSPIAPETDNICAFDCLIRRNNARRYHDISSMQRRAPKDSEFNNEFPEHDIRLSNKEAIRRDIKMVIDALGTPRNCQRKITVEKSNNFEEKTRDGTTDTYCDRASKYYPTSDDSEVEYLFYNQPTVRRENKFEERNFQNQQKRNRISDSFQKDAKIQSAPVSKNDPLKDQKNKYSIKKIQTSSIYPSQSDRLLKTKRVAEISPYGESDVKWKIIIKQRKETINADNSTNKQ